MSNPLEIQNSSKMIQSRVDALFGVILDDYRRGNIKTKVELQYKLFVAMQQFYNNLGKPTLDVKPLWGPPVSSDWNTMMQQSYNDIATIMSECDLMATGVNESFAQIETQRKSWAQDIQKMKDHMADIEHRINAKPNEEIFVERFANMKQYDMDMVTQAAADVVKESQVLTLKRSYAEDITDSLIVRVISGDGFPGNTHQVRAVSGAYKFYGEDNLHMNLAEIVDGNQDTWFEYERFEVNSSTMESTGGYGFQYKEGFPWAQVSVPSMTLVVQVYLPATRTINWLNVAPFIPSDKGVTAANITSIVISDGKGTYTELSSGNDKFDKELIKQFPKIDCRTVTITFAQKTPYDTRIGHVYFNELEQQNVGYLNKNSQDAAGKRVEGVLPSIENVQLHYDPSSKSLTLPVVNKGDTVTNEDAIKKSLFQLPPNPDGTQVALEALDAWRFMVGIREIGVSEYQFEAVSEYTSVAYETEKPITEIRLDVTQEIPDVFQSSKERTSWIQYYISIDEGRNWNAIAPTGQTGAVTKYLINSNTPKEARFADCGYLDTLDDVKKVRVRIDMYRPTTIVDPEYYTPIVRQYKLHLLTEGEQ